MEIPPVSTMFWLPRETGLEMILERKLRLDYADEEKDTLPTIDSFPTYLPTEQLRRIMSKGIFFNAYA